MSDAFDEVEQQMGFGGDEPEHYLRLKNEGDTEIAIFNNVETVPANRKEIEGGYCRTNKDGQDVTTLYTFVSPLTGRERSHRDSGQALFIGLRNSIAPEVDAAGHHLTRKPNPGEGVKMVRTGEGKAKRITCTIMSKEQLDKYIKDNSPSGQQSAPVEPMAPASEQENINIDDIPF